MERLNANLTRVTMSSTFTVTTTTSLFTRSIIKKNHNMANLNETTMATVAGANGGDLISKYTSDMIIFILQCVLFPVITAFGVAGNMVSFIVLLQKRLFNPTAILLIGLTVADAIFILTTFLRKTTCIMERFDPYFANGFYGHTFVPLFYLALSTSRVSTLLVMAISIERFVAVAFPLKVRFISTKFRMTFAVLSIYILTFGLLSLFPAQMSIQQNNGWYYLVRTNFYRNNIDFLSVYNTYFSTIVFRWIPRFTVIVLNAGICCMLKRRQLLNKDIPRSTALNRRYKEQRRMTNMLVIVAVVFVVFLIPGDVFLIMSDTIDGFSLFGRYKYTFQVFSDITLLFEMINSSINFVIYMSVNRNFSEVYLMVFCPCRTQFFSKMPRGNENGSSHSSTNLADSQSQNSQVFQVPIS